MESTGSYAYRCRVAYFKFKISINGSNKPIQINDFKEF